MPDGTLVKKGNRNVSVYLPRTHKPTHWLFWVLILGSTYRGSLYSWLVGLVVFLTTPLPYLWWIFARPRIVFFEDRLIFRFGIGILSSRKVMSYDGLECELEDGRISLFHSDTHQTRHLILPGSTWLQALIRSVIDKSDETLLPLIDEGRCNGSSRRASDLVWRRGCQTKKWIGSLFLKKNGVNG